MIRLSKQFADNILKEYLAKKEVQKVEGKLYKLQQKQKRLMLDMKMGCTHSGSSVDEDGTCGANYWVFPASKSDEEIYEILEDNGLCQRTDRGVYDDNDWDCSGLPCFNGAYIDKKTKTRKLVIRTWTLDI
tara:strand:+ start:284 stop:676 length:393 start_codon:yes stop_codon:yes gene_type:complete